MRIMAQKDYYKFKCCRQDYFWRNLEVTLDIVTAVLRYRLIDSGLVKLVI